MNHPHAGFRPRRRPHARQEPGRESPLGHSGDPSERRPAVSPGAAATWSLIVLVAVVFALVVTVASAWAPHDRQLSGYAPHPPVNEARLVGYFAQWGVYERGYHVKNLHTSGTAAQLTHLNYAFGKVADGRCEVADVAADFGRPYDAASSVDGRADVGELHGNLGQLRKLKRMYPHLKVLWAFGGWNNSDGFGEAARNPEIFAESCHNLVRDPRWADVFDGIDIDWEYPNACGRTCDSSGHAAFERVLRAMRDRFGSRSLVTAAITAGDGNLDAADYTGAASHVDWYNVMTYDFAAGSPQGPTTPHSPLTSTETSVRKLLGMGVQAGKLLPGIGFYGRGWTGVAQDEPGARAGDLAAGTYEKGVEDYKILKETCPPVGDIAGTAYARCGDNWWSYDTPATIARKMEWLRRWGLGGAFVWELSGDTDNGELITAMRGGLS